LVRRRWLWQRFVGGTLNLLKHRRFIIMGWDANGQEVHRHHTLDLRFFVRRRWLWRRSWGANDRVYVKKYSLDIFPHDREISTWRPRPFRHAIVPGPVDSLDQNRPAFRIIEAVIEASMYGRI
jgi:hypothetical protein